MEGMHYQQLRHALKIIKTAASAHDVDTLRRNVLNVLSETFYTEKGLFILPDEAGQFTDFSARNVEEKYERQFKEYYYRYDPFNLIPGDACRRRVVRAEDIVSYPSFLSSEYYNDFLRPQQIYYKAVLYLKTKDKLLGMIALLRPKGTESFSGEDVALLRSVAPHISHALEDLQLRKTIGIRENIFKALESQVSGALIVLDDSWNVLYSNGKAEELCRKLSGSSLRSDHAAAAPAVLLEDCVGLREEFRTSSVCWAILPRYRVLDDVSSAAYAVRSQLLSRAVNPGQCPLFVISIEQIDGGQTALRTGGEAKLKSAYRLSEREVEVVAAVCEGLRNSQIAEKLFISEITVKKHIQNVFDKMGVQSRSALIHKVLTSEFS